MGNREHVKGRIRRIEKLVGAAAGMRWDFNLAQWVRLSYLLDEAPSEPSAFFAWAVEKAGEPKGLVKVTLSELFAPYITSAPEVRS